MDGASSFLRIIDEAMADVFNRIRISDAPMKKAWAHVRKGVTCICGTDPSNEPEEVEEEVDEKKKNDEDHNMEGV